MDLKTEHLKCREPFSKVNCPLFENGIALYVFTRIANFLSVWVCKSWAYCKENLKTEGKVEVLHYECISVHMEMKFEARQEDRGQFGVNGLSTKENILKQLFS